MNNEITLHSIKHFELNVECPICHAKVGQGCRRLPLPRQACLFLDCSCGSPLPSGIYHEVRRELFKARCREVLCKGDVAPTPEEVQ